MSSPIDNLRAVAASLGELREHVVFVGGATLALLVTDPAAPPARPTDDVDAIARTSTRVQYSAFCARLRLLGFSEDPDGPVCRWRIAGIKIDFMPPIEAILGFTNRWYPAAIAHAARLTLDGMQLQLIAAPYAIATKLEAYDARGAGDYAASHDSEDIVTIVDGRAELVGEVRASAPDLRLFLAERVARLLADEAFLAAIPGHIAGDDTSQARFPLILDRLRKIASSRE